MGDDPESSLTTRRPIPTPPRLVRATQFNMFKATRVMAMQPTRMMFMRQSPQLYMRQTARMMRAVPKEEQGAHTISQRLRTLRKIPAELIPLGVVLSIAIVFAAFSMARKLMTDKTLRLKRQAGREQIALLEG